MSSPGSPQLKLWPDTITAFRIDPRSLAPLHSKVEKQAQYVSAALALSPSPLLSLYVLDQGEEHAIESLPLKEAFSEIIQHSYAARFIGKAGIPAWHFHQCAALTRAVPVHRFRRKPSLALLPEALDVLEAHLKSPSQNCLPSQPQERSNDG